MTLVLIGIALILAVIILVKYVDVTHSTIYSGLWLLSGVYLLTDKDLRNLFGELFPSDDFGLLNVFFEYFFFVFAAATVLHQYFIYRYLHELESLPEKWKNLYPGFYNSLFDKSIRLLAFILLLIIIGKVPLTKKLLHEHAISANISDGLALLLCGSCTLFTLLFIYDLVAGFWSKKITSIDHWLLSIGDLLASIFWWIVVYKVLISNDGSMGAIAIVPLLFGLLYFGFFVFRFIRSVMVKEPIE